jgi:hypothetical protein
MTDFRDDTSRLDAFLASRRRAAVLHAMWRPVLAGAVASLAVSAAIWVVLPRFEVREVVVDHVVQHETPLEVPKITMRPVEVPEITTHPVDIPIPHFVSPAPETSAATAPRTPAERRFEDGDAWGDPSVMVRGRILREQDNGFVMATDEGEASFFPAKIGPNGPEPNPGMKDLVAPYLGDLCACSQLPNKTYRCVALHDGAEIEIRQVPNGHPPAGGKPTRAPPAVVGR